MPWFSATIFIVLQAKFKSKLQDCTFRIYLLGSLLLTIHVDNPEIRPSLNRNCLRNGDCLLQYFDVGFPASRFRRLWLSKNALFLPLPPFPGHTIAHRKGLTPWERIADFQWRFLAASSPARTVVRELAAWAKMRSSVEMLLWTCAMRALPNAGWQLAPKRFFKQGGCAKLIDATSAEIVVGRIDT